VTTPPVRESPVDEVSGPREPTSGEARHERAALIAFVVLLVAAVPIVLLGVGSYHWFFRDDFFFVAGRKATSVDDLFRPHNGHWSTVPILAFRMLWAVFGMRTYVPYQATVLAMHLASCALLRVIMRRAGVNPWVATVVAASFVLFGPGEEDIIWAFQIGYTGSLMFGLTQLVLADHDGPVDKRDWLGIVAGVLALLCSGVGIAMAIVAGGAILGRRGWRVAALHVAPVAITYVVWWSIEHPQLANPFFGRPTPAVIFRWVRSSQIGIFLALGHFQVAAALLAVAFVVGLVLAWSRLPVSELRRRASIPVALLLGGLVFATFTSIDRWFQGAHSARSSRYMHIGVALALPALAVAIDALCRRWRTVGVVAIASLVVAIPWNATHFGDQAGFGSAYMNSRKRVLTNIVRLPEAREVPRDVRPIPDVFVGPDLTIGFLLDAESSGKLSVPKSPLSPDLTEQLRIGLGVGQWPDGTPTDCIRRSGPMIVRPERGAVFGITTPLDIASRYGVGQVSHSVSFSPGNGNRLTIELAGLDLRLAPPKGAPFFTLCTIGGRSLVPAG
jgi:hypothetical protein